VSVRALAVDVIV